MTQSDLDTKFKEHQSHDNTNVNTKRDFRESNNDSALRDFMAHYSGACNNPDCAIHALKQDTTKGAYAKGVNVGIAFGAKASKKGLI